VFEGLPDDLYAELSRYAGTAGRLEDLPALHESDWDLLVTFDASPRHPYRMHVLSFGGTTFRSIWKTGPGQFPENYSAASFPARQVVVAPGAPTEWKSLIARSVVETASPAHRI